MIIDLLRHGTPQGGRMYRGNSIDDQLSSKGWEEMKLALGSQKWDYIATSPMKRCFEFANYFSNKSDTPLKVVDGFKEIGFGDWEGKTIFDIGQQNVNNFKKDPIKNKVNNSEEIGHFCDRVIESYHEIIHSFPNSCRILIIAHAGVIRVILSEERNSPYNEMFNINIANGELIRIEI